MNTIAIIAMLVGGAVVIGGFLIKLFGNSQHDAGKLEERDAETQRSAEAKGRADEVLAEHRDPDDAVKRLRDHNF